MCVPAAEADYLYKADFVILKITVVYVKISSRNGRLVKIYQQTIFVLFRQKIELKGFETIIIRRPTGLQVFLTLTVIATHQYQCEHVGQWHGNSDDQRSFPATGDGVRGGDEKESDEVEHVQGGRQRAPELRLAHLAAVRYAQTGGETRAQTHEHRARVQGAHRDRENDHDHNGRQLDEIGERHAQPVAEPRLDQRQEQAPDGW